MKTGRLLLIPALLLSACASKNDLNYVQGQVSELKQESRVIKEQSAGSYSEITQYREEIAALRGKIDELRHNYEVSMRRIDMEDSLLVRKTDTLESRIAKIEHTLADNAAAGGAHVQGGEEAVALDIVLGAQAAGAGEAGHEAFGVAGGKDEGLRSAGRENQHRRANAVAQRNRRVKPGRSRHIQRQVLWAGNRRMNR